MRSVPISRIMVMLAESSIADRRVRLRRRPTLTRKLILILFLVIPGALVAAICGYFALADYAQLQKGYAHFQSVASSGSDLRTVFVAYAGQDVHRTNVFAEGVWALMGLIIAALGLLGLCGGSRK